MNDFDMIVKSLAKGATKVTIFRKLSKLELIALQPLNVTVKQGADYAIISA